MNVKSNPDRVTRKSTMVDGFEPTRARTARWTRAATTALAVAILTACGGHVSKESSSAPPDQARGSKTGTPGEPARVADGPSRMEDSVLPMLRPAMPPPANEAVDQSGPNSTAESDAVAKQIIVTGHPVARTAPLRNGSALAFSAGAPATIAHPGIAPPPVDRERYEDIEDPGLKVAAESPVSTFSIDVDTGAYSNVRRFLSDGQLPPKDAVRVEELINYFSYRDDGPANDHPFAVTTTLAATPWNPQTRLLRIGIQGRTVDATERPAGNLVFLVDVSGSMSSHDKLPLLIDSLSMLTQQMNDRDRVSLVVYAGASGVVLPPTAGDDRARILDALHNLRAGGSTNGASGIRLAYQLARGAFIEDGINRVILATDGDFNVGLADTGKLIDLIERERASGVSLTTLGFGRGNLNDHMMERIADAGNGNYAYIDSLAEARKVLVNEVGSTLQTIASDVKIQVEFNPAQVAEYRLIGYANRQLRREDFNNDKVDAGEIGAGHSVTALYEITPTDSAARQVDALRYAPVATTQDAMDSELAFVRLRYKAPGESTSTLIERAVDADSVIDPRDTSDDFRFSAAVAAFGETLRGGTYLGDYSLTEVRDLAAGAAGTDAYGYRAEFLDLVSEANALLNHHGEPDHQIAGQR